VSWAGETPAPRLIHSPPPLQVTHQAPPVQLMPVINEQRESLISASSTHLFDEELAPEEGRTAWWLRAWALEPDRLDANPTATFQMETLGLPSLICKIGTNFSSQDFQRSNTS